MELLAPWPDVEDVLLDMLAPEGPTRLVRPDEIASPFIQVAGLPGGGGDRITGRFRAEVQCWTFNDYDGCRDMAKRCEQRILAAPGHGFAGACVDNTSVETHPTYASYGDPNIVRFTATYRLEFRR